MVSFPALAELVQPLAKLTDLIAETVDFNTWSYPQPLAGAEALAKCVAFYARDLACSVGGLAATPQPGGFYGGWVTPDLAGPFKGAAGSETW